MSCPKELSALEALWRSKRGTRRLPSRSDFTPENLRPWLGNLGIVAVERAQRLRFRVLLSGTRLDDYRGFGVTGRYLDEICGNGFRSLRRYLDCVTRGEPVHLVHDNSSNSRIYARMAKILLPLSEDGVTVDRILMAIYPLPANDGDDLPQTPSALAG